MDQELAQSARRRAGRGAHRDHRGGIGRHHARRGLAGGRRAGGGAHYLGPTGGQEAGTAERSRRFCRLDLYRPLLSYDELGTILEGRPVDFYDQLFKLLGLEQLTSAIARLDAEVGRLKLWRAGKISTYLTLPSRALTSPRSPAYTGSAWRWWVSSCEPMGWRPPILLAPCASAGVGVRSRSQPDASEAAQTGTAGPRPRRRWTSRSRPCRPVGLGVEHEGCVPSVGRWGRPRHPSAGGLPLPHTPAAVTCVVNRNS